MALVSYSDSEGSDDEQQTTTAPKKVPTPPPASKAGFNAIVDRSNPRKIRVNLSEKKEETDGEPAAKKPRLGGGGFGGFNAMLPAPKRATQTSSASTAATKGAPRKVFSLKTGAEPGFSRESDAELRQLFSEQETERQPSTEASYSQTEGPIPVSTPSSNDSTPKPKVGTPMMFKPLSVARNPQKKRKTLPNTNGDQSKSATPDVDRSTAPSPSPGLTTSAPPPPPKVSLFSMRTEAEQPSAPLNPPTQTEYQPLVYTHDTPDPQPQSEYPTTTSLPSSSNPQSLSSIASDLNLTPSQQRQLFGRSKPSSSSSQPTPLSIKNFNTDEEYASNAAALRAAGEEASKEHRVVKGVMGGKHSLKQLISSASGQMEALEESFAEGKRGKREAGGRYGW